MATDLDNIQAASQVKIVGQTASGLETTPVKSTTGGGLHACLRDEAGDERGNQANPMIVSQGYAYTSLPATQTVMKRGIISPNTSVFYEYLVSVKVAFRNFNFGGRAAGEGFIARYVAAVNSFVSGDAFNSIANVATWINTSLGSSLVPSWAYATDQFVEGTGSAKLTFTKSDNNNYPEITYNFPTPIDGNLWRYIRAQVRTTVAAGGNQTRTVSVRLTSGTAIRIYHITGNTTTAPFNVEQWHTILKELKSPDATAGTGVFDLNSINSISLRLQDGGNKAGSIWWDDVQFLGQLTILDKIYTNGDTIPKFLEPPLIFDIGETLILCSRNNSATATEFQVDASGVNI